jgi:hypothetical protein
MPLDGSINTIPAIDASYIGFYYAYEASGGFNIEQGVGATTMYPYNKINRYDVTNSLQVKYDVRIFNQKLGLIKDASNIGILNTTYNPELNNFPVDYVTLTAAEFSSEVREKDIISVGFYSTLYMNFQILVNVWSCGLKSVRPALSVARGLVVFFDAYIESSIRERASNRTTRP